MSSAGDVGGFEEYRAGGGRKYVVPNEVLFTEVEASADLAWRG